MTKVPRFVTEYFHYMEKENTDKWKAGYFVLDEFETWKARTEISIRKYQLGLIPLKEVMIDIGNNPISRK